MHPAKHGKFLERLIRKWDLNGNKNFQKKFQIFLPVKKELLLLHPQQRQRSFKYWQAIDTKEEKFSKKKYQKKFVRNKNVTYLCTPQNTESSLKDW